MQAHAPAFVTCRSMGKLVKSQLQTPRSISSAFLLGYLFPFYERMSSDKPRMMFLLNIPLALRKQYTLPSQLWMEAFESAAKPKNQMT